VLTKEDLAIGTYRRTVSILLPKMTQVAVADYGKKMQQAEPTFVPKKLIYRVSKADYQKQFGNSYHRPGPGTRFLAFLLRSPCHRSTSIPVKPPRRPNTRSLTRPTPATSPCWSSRGRPHRRPPRRRPGLLPRPPM
jgi:hypothetical protein